MRIGVRSKNLALSVNLNFLRYLLIYICSFLLSLSVDAQVNVGGKLLDVKDRLPLPMAIVTLISLPDSAATTTSTDLKGEFLFTAIPVGDYLFSASYIGYKPTLFHFRADNNTSALGEIFMEAGEVELDEVMIVERAPPSTQIDDTTQYNAAAFKTAPDASAEDLVQKMPGISIQDGRVQAQGEQVRRVLVDGKPFFGDDPSAVLRNLPAEIIAMIQVFDEQSDQARFSGFDDGNTGKAINIITKPGMRNGTFGKVYAGYGYENIYQAGGNINILRNDRRISILGQSNNINRQNFSSEDLAGISSGSGNRGGGGGRGRGGSGVNDFLVSQRNGINTTHAIGINYTDKWREKVDVSGSYFFNLGDNDARTTMQRTYILPGDTGRVYSESNFVDSRNINHRINLRMDYQIDSLQSLLIHPRLTVQQNTGNSLNSGQTNLAALLQNETSNTFSSELTAIRFNNELLYRRRLGKVGRTISTGLNVGVNSYNGDNLLNAANMYYSDVAISDSLDQQAALDRSEWSIGVNAVYTEPAGKKGQIQLNYNNSYSFSDSDKKTNNYDKDSELFNVLDSTLSNTFTYRYLSQQGAIHYRYTAEKYNFMLGIGYQWSRIDNEQEFPVANTVLRSFHNILPRANFRYNFSRTKQLRFFYRTRTNMPSAEQLQEVPDNSAPLQLRTGNAGLKEDLSHFLTIRYSGTNIEKSTSTFALLGITVIQDYIGRITDFATRDTTIAGIYLPAGTQLTRPQNMQGYIGIRSFASYGVPLKFISSNLNMNAGFNYARTPGIINGLSSETHSPSLSAGLVISSNIKPVIDFTISSSSAVNWVKNRLNASLDTRYYSQRSSARINWIYWKGMFVNTEFSHQLYSGLGSGFDRSYFLWNLGTGAAFLKDKAVELRFSVFDVLGQNTSVVRNSTDAWYEDVTSNTLGRYYMLTITYNIRKYRS